ncbi:MAG: hypothetical protein K1060chlam2_00579 [Chlamydiae bacterium]|nr:hypothetical protein [Chlamydiota bacterium]
MTVLNHWGQKLATLLRQSTPIDQTLSGEMDTEEENNFFQSALPFRTYCSETQLYYNKNSRGFCIEVVPLIGSSDFLESELASLISDLGEEGDSIQCLLLADHRIAPLLKTWEEARKKQGGIFAKIASKKTQFFTEGLREQTDCPPPRNFRFFFSYSSSKQGAAELISKKEKALSFFSRISHAKEVQVEAFLTAFSGLINFNGKADICARAVNPFNYIANGLCLPGCIEDEGTHLKFTNDGEETYFKAFEVLEFPSNWSLGGNQLLIGDFFQQERGLFSDFFIHYGIFFPSQATAEARIKSKSKLLEQQLKFKAMRKLFSSAPREHEESLFVEKEMLNGKKIIQTRMTVGMFAKADRMVDAEGALKATYSRAGFKIASCDYLHADEFVRSLPMTWGESSNQRETKLLRAFKTTTTHEVGVFIPLLGEWMGNSSTGMPLIGRRGQFATWDQFETEGNLNAVIVGASGTGKSVFMQEMIMSQLGMGGRVFVLDLGRSFEKLCELLDGQYLFFTKESRLNLNPFALLPEEGDSEVLDAALNMVSSIVATMAMPMEKIDGDRSNMLSIAVKMAWENSGRKATIDHVVESLKSGSYTTERMRGGSESLIDALQKYTTKGEFKNFFYGKKKVSFRSNFVVIETEELKNMGDLQAVILQIFSLMISSEVFMGDRKKRSLICIDEAWDLLKSPQMEGFIESMARRLRKYNGALMVGTQSLKDFDCSPGAAAAFQNSNWLVLLGKDGNTIPTIKEKNLIELDGQIEKYLSSLKKVDGKYSEAFIYNKGSGFYGLAQLKLDPFSAQLYSTRAENFHAIQALKKEGYSIEEAIEKILSQGSVHV